MRKREENISIGWSSEKEKRNLWVPTNKKKKKLIFRAGVEKNTLHAWAQVLIFRISSSFLIEKEESDL
jgi:hypothetical protein